MVFREKNTTFVWILTRVSCGSPSDESWCDLQVAPRRVDPWGPEAPRYLWGAGLKMEPKARRRGWSRGATTQASSRLRARLFGDKPCSVAPSSQSHTTLRSAPRTSEPNSMHDLQLLTKAQGSACRARRAHLSRLSHLAPLSFLLEWWASEPRGTIARRALLDAPAESERWARLRPKPPRSWPTPTQSNRLQNHRSQPQSSLSVAQLRSSPAQAEPARTFVEAQLDVAEPIPDLVFVGG